MTWNLFLAPADHGNLRVSVIGEVPFKKVSHFLVRVRAVDPVKCLLSRKGGFHCWATTEEDRFEYEAMVGGDILLFPVNGTQFFRHAAEVVDKLMNDVVMEGV